MQSIVFKLVGLVASLLIAGGCVFGTPVASPTAAPAKAADSKPAAPATSAPAAPASAPAAAAAPQASPAAAASKPAARPAFSVPSTPMTISLWHTTHPERNAYLKDAIIPRFRQKYPNVTVEMDTAPSNQIEQKVLAALAGGGGPEIFWAFDNSLVPYIAKGLVAPVDPAAYGYATQDELMATFLPNTLNGYIIDGKLYSLPFQENSFSLYLNNRHFKEAGLDPVRDAPKTWDDVTTLAQKLTRTDASGKITRHGFRWSVGNPTWTYYQIAPIIQQLGGNVLDANNKCIANSEAGVKAVQFRADSVFKYKTEDPAVTLNTPAAPLDDFVKEAVSIWLSSSAASDPWIRNANPDLFNGGYSAVPVPQFNPSKPATITYGQSFLINARSSPEKQAAAQALVAEALANSTEWLTRVGVISPTKQLRDSLEAKSYPFMEVFLTDMERGRFVPRHAQFPEIRDAFHRAIDRVVFNKEDVKKSLDQLCGEVDRALGTR